MKLIARKGYVGATTEIIAREAGLTKGALYFHFGNKEDIFVEVVKNLGEKHAEHVIRPLLENKNPSKGLEEMITAAIELVEKRKYFGLEFWQQASRVKRINSYMDYQHKRIETALVNYLKKYYGMKKRESESLYLILHTLFDGIVIRHQCCHSCVDFERLKKDVFKMIKLYLHGRLKKEHEIK